MPAITALTISGVRPLGRALMSAAGWTGRGLKSLATRVKNRREAHRLAALDDRMLADIGLNRSDLRDAFAELPWRDPSEVLVRRAAERRVPRRLTDPASSAPSPSCYTPINRPARYLV